MQMAGGALKSCKCKLGNRQEDGEEGMLTAHGHRMIKSDFLASALLALNSSKAIKRGNAKQHPSKWPRAILEGLKNSSDIESHITESCVILMLSTESSEIMYGN